MNNYRLLAVALAGLLLLAQSYSPAWEAQITKSKIGGQKIFANAVKVRFKAGKTNPFKSDKKIQLSGESVSLGEPMLKPSQSVEYSKKAKLRAQSDNLNLAEIIEAEEPLLRTYVIRYNSDAHPESYCEYLLKNYPEIEIAEPIYPPELRQNLPNDPYAAQQALLYNLQVIDAWQIEEGDSSVVIGISDNGIQQHHEDLRESIAPNWADPTNGVDDDENGYTDDFLGYDLSGNNQPPWNTYHYDLHGTQVAGIAAAVVNNDTGIAGIANKCRFFPIKIADGANLAYSYESVIYAAVRGFEVLNCSWGVEKPFSVIDQSIINYATARDVLIVASAGNEYGSVVANYPSAYDKVLAVGEVDQNDVFSGNNIGEWLDILAPGGGNWYTDSNDGYGNSAKGSSYSSPVVSGIAALVRTKYPELTALQAAETVRIAVDDVSDDTFNEDWKNILPGRVNAYKAVSRDPFSNPSIRPKKITYVNQNGVEGNRFPVGDTINIKIDAHNFLGAASDVNFEISTSLDEMESVKIINSTVFVEEIERESDLTLDGFNFVIERSNSNKMFFRVEIETGSGFKDFFLIEFIPSPVVTTFSNEAIKFSVSDRGTIGFGGNKNNESGAGFSYKDKGNQLYKACFMATEFMGRFVSSIYWDQYSGDFNDFSTLKSYVPPNKYVGVFDDSKASEGSLIGIKVTQQLEVNDGVFPVVKANLTIENITQNRFVDFSSGYYFDWDVKDSDSNAVSLFPEGLPDGYDPAAYAAEIVEYVGGDYPVCGCGALSFEDGAEGQAAGLNNRTNSIHDDDVPIQALTSGKSMQAQGMIDGSVVVGAKFNGEFQAGEKKDYSFVFGCAENKDSLAYYFKSALDTNYTDAARAIDYGFDARVYPQPANDYVVLRVSSPINANLTCAVYDLSGRKILSFVEFVNEGVTDIPINSSGIESGIYYVKMTIGRYSTVKRLAVAR